MIEILRNINIRPRTFGWVQNPSNFRSLCNVVAIFDPDSIKHNQLKNQTLPNIVSTDNGLEALIAAMNVRPLNINYSYLVGTGRSNRSTAPCDALVQAMVPGQGTKLYTDNWTADGFVRWAHCLGFIKYDYTNDTFSITETGLNLSAAYNSDGEPNDEEHRILVDAILSYPPAIRVLSLLSTEDAHMTKFEIGKQLGFIGESGFTSMPQSVFIRSISMTTDGAERSKIRANWEGSSDKYARMIASWLIKLGLISKAAKEITVTLATESYTDRVGQAYIITADGITALRRARGVSRHNRISKTVSFEMLATQGNDREFLRKRRGLILKKLSEHRGSITSTEIMKFLEDYNVSVTRETVADDIKGFINIGLDVNINENSFTWNDRIKDFIIPLREGVEPTEYEQIKDELRGNITHISHDYLTLIDLAYDSTQNRLFEIKTLQLLTEECGYNGLHLGGTRKPDGIIYTSDQNENYGVIIDTKSYSGGYNLPISQADSMQRYVQENQRRDENENPNKWWENFRTDISRYYFMFVAGHFTGRYQDQIDRISRITNTRGTSIEVCDLLLIAESIKDRTNNLSAVEDVLFSSE